MTTSSTPNPTPSVLDRLRRLFGGQTADGRLGSKVKAARALDLVRDGATLLDVRAEREWESGQRSEGRRGLVPPPGWCADPVGNHVLSSLDHPRHHWGRSSAC